VVLELDPRQRITAIDLAKELNFSRTPVREAFIMLEKDELITRYNQDRGSIAKKLLDLLFYHLSHGVFGKLLDKNDLFGTFPVM